MVIHRSSLPQVNKVVDKSDSKSEEKLKPAEKPISLRPLEFEEAVGALLRVKPVREGGD